MPRCPNGTRKNKITGKCETQKNKGKEEEIEEIEEINKDINENINNIDKITNIDV